MSDYSGEDLLNVFNDLHIEMANLNPNVIKAWFDTDCKNMKQLLNWMCTSLSKENYLAAHENLEYSQIECPYEGEKFEREVRSIESQYPDIFNIESNLFDIQLAEDEVDLLEEDEMHVDELIIMNERLQESLSKELAQVTSEEISSSLKCKEAQEKCGALTVKLDDLNLKLQKQILKYGALLYDFEFSEVPLFINNMDTNEFQETIDHTATFLHTILKGEISDDYLSGKTLLDVTSSDDSIINNLNVIRDRLFYSRQNYLAHKIEEEKLNAVLNYCNNSSIDTIITMVESIFMEANLETKEEQKGLMIEMLENISSKIAQHHICQPRLRYAQKELEIYQSKLEGLKKITHYIVKILSNSLVISILYNQEKKDIGSSYTFFKKIVEYITKDLQNCRSRANAMESIIQDYNEYQLKPTGEKCGLLKTIINVFSGKDYSLNSALECVSELNTMLTNMEIKLFRNDCLEHRNQMKEMERNNNILQKFLVCGPTNRIVVVPSELYFSILEAEKCLQEQNSSIKATIETSSKMKKSNSKWDQYRRLLWIYFLTEPSKLNFILQQIEIDVKKQHKNV